MKRASKAIASAVLFPLCVGLVAPCARADEKDGNFKGKLQGRYAFTEIQTCYISPPGFNVDFTPIAPNPRANQASVSGIYDFNGNGTGTGTIRFGVVFANPPLAPNAVSQTEGTCDVQYVVSPDGSVLLDRSCTATATAGVGTGSVNSAIVRQLLQLTQGGRGALIMTPPEPIIETTMNDGIMSYRICARTGVLSKIHPD